MISAIIQYPSPHVHVAREEREPRHHLRHARMVGDQRHQREKFLVIAAGLSLAEGDDAMFGNTDHVFFRLSGKTEPHDQRPLP